MGYSLDQKTGSLYVDGQRYPVSVREGQLLAKLLAGEIVKSPNGGESSEGAQLRAYVAKLRRRTPLTIQCLGQGRGYCLENYMADHTKSRPKVEHAIKAIRGALKESSIRDGMTHGAIDISTETGIGKSSHSTDDVTIDIVVTPKEAKG